MGQKGFAPLIIILIVAVIIVIGGAYYYAQKPSALISPAVQRNSQAISQLVPSSSASNPSIISSNPASWYDCVKTSGSVIVSDTCRTQDGKSFIQPSDVRPCITFKDFPGCPTSYDLQFKIPLSRANFNFIAPTVGDVWKVGAQSVISWNKELSVTGMLYLIYAKNKRVAGIILPQVDQHQTSYTWDTKNLFINRVDSQKKIVTPETYMIVLIGDSNGRPGMYSRPFSVTP